MISQALVDSLSTMSTRKWYGKVTRVVGLTIESTGPIAAVGDICFIHSGRNGSGRIQAEVVGFKENNVLLMPFSDTVEIAPGNLVECTEKPLSVPVGPSLIGQIIDAVGQPLTTSSMKEPVAWVPAEQSPPNPLQRPRITERLGLGVRVIDGLFSVGKGQRMGIFAGSGVGKSTLLAMIAKYSTADVNVIALIGERGREVRDFVERDLGEEGMKKTVLLVVTSDQPALMRVKGAMTATAVAEYFRDQGLSVNLMMDSVTRFAMAQREIGLAIGEPPTTKGYPPSVFAMLPKLLERSGTNEHGSITAFYTVLVDGDDMNEPIADAVRGILDGHLVLDRQLANKGQFPAIHVLKSVSRVMSDIVSTQHKTAAATLRELLSIYTDAEDLISIGAYKRGSNMKLDEAVAAHPDIVAFIKQATNEQVTFEETERQLVDRF